MLTLKNYLLDIIFPRRCLGCDIILAPTPNERRRQSRQELKSARCGVGVGDSCVCRLCLKTIAFKNDFACAFCKSPVKNGKTCPYCLKDYFLDRLLVTTSYENPLVEKMLKTMKYRFVASLANEISDLMIRYLKKRMTTKLGLNLESPIVMPVPLHFKRLNWRGFNQAEIMAQGIGNFFGWPVATKILHRKNRKPQADMPDRSSRIQNAQNLFKISPIYQSSTLIDYPQDRKIVIADKTILLIDDVSTTGSTLNDCARALKGAGAKEVIGFVFARNRRSTPQKRRI